ncbi:uncharacterized protein [Drosophila tropicalis]|uniref:uncharacterized protein n=1 Tax=Drosophila tropicalis TaxID=46794 RepID=UPI0035ABED32
MRSHLLRFFLGWLSVGALALVMEKERTAPLPWLYWLAYPAAVQQVGAPLPGIPIRRPQREELTTSTTTSRPLQDAMETIDNSFIREQFLQGIIQGLQQSASPTIQPEVLADFLSQATATTTTSTTEKSIIEKDAHENENDNDDDYDYIDFKNGSRIKYELDEGESHKLFAPTTKPSVVRPQPNPVYYFYRPYYHYY